MLAILTTHPIQYQIPLWRMLARENEVPLEVWYLSGHGASRSRDREFQENFAWDLEMLEGYPYRFLKTPSGSTPNTPLRLRIAESLPELFPEHHVTALWVQGWQVAAYWQAVWAAKRAGLEVWLRGESNVMAPTPSWKKIIKRPLLGQLFRRVDHFLCIGTANRELYRSYGVAESALHMAPYAVDNERFAAQASEIRDSKSTIRKQWRIPEGAYVVLFCGKFISKKRPLDLIKAAQLLLGSHPNMKIHLLFVGSGELGPEMRSHCKIIFDAGNPNLSPLTHRSSLPKASFTGFLNQTEISRAYVAADCLVLPSDYGETWGLVVNEAMASGLPCIISDHCGSAADLGPLSSNLVYQCGEVDELAGSISQMMGMRPRLAPPPSLIETAAVVEKIYRRVAA